MTGIDKSPIEKTPTGIFSPEDIKDMRDELVRGDRAEETRLSREDRARMIVRGKMDAPSEG